MDGIVLLTVGIVLFCAGMFLRHYALRRQFYRRNIAGVEVFSNYKSMLVKKSIEFCATVAGWLFLVYSLGCIVVSVLLLWQK